MNKKVSLVLRLIIALLGITFIAYSVTWRDHVVVPARTMLPSGTVLDQSTRFRVISGTPDADSRDASAVVKVEVIEANQPPVTMAIPSAQFGLRNEDHHFVPGVLRMLREANLPLLLAATLMVGAIYPIQVVRWWLLLRARGIDIKLWMAFKLTMIGCFFNYCMPGSTGGDLVKAYYAAKRKEGRADAVMTVLMDRVVGLFGLIALAGLVGLTMLNHPVARQVTMYVWLGISSVAIGSMLYFSARIRRTLKLGVLLGWMPDKVRSLVTTIDGAMVAYRHHVGVVSLTLGMSLIVHLLLTTATTVSGYALGMEAPMGLFLTVLPILFLAGALPFFYQGLGVMEGLAMMTLLNPPMATANHLVGMLLLIRIYQLLYSLIGSLFLIRGNVHMLTDTEKEEVPAPVA